MQWSFSDIIDIHHSINHASNHCIGRIIANLPINLQRVLLLTFLKFLFLKKNRSQYIHQKDGDSNLFEILKTTHRVLDAPNRKSKRNKVRRLIHNGNICGRLDMKLLSHSISFLDQSSRCNASRVNLAFLSASTAPIFKHHLCINKNVCSEMKQRILEPQELEQFESIDWSHSYRCHKRGDLNLNSTRFRQNLTNLFQSNALKTLKISTHCDSKDVLPDIERIGIRNAERLVIEPDRIHSSASNHSCPPMEIPSDDLHRLKYIECGMNNMQSLWMNRPNKANGSIPVPSNPIPDLTPYVIPSNPSSEIREIRFHFHHGFDQVVPYGTTLHPIYWLWNIPKLETCHLRVTIHSDSEFIGMCNAMMKHKIVRKKAKQQKLKTLVVLLDSDRMESISIFSEHARTLYPNLESLTIHKLQQFAARKMTVDIDWMLFDRLKEIKLELPNIQYGIDILQFINKTENEQSGEFRNLEVLHLLKMAVEYDQYEPLKEDKKKTPPIVQLVLWTSVLIKNRPLRLRSFNVDVASLEHVHHRNVVDTYFRPHRVLTNALVQLMDLNDIYDGYLRVNIPLNGRMLRANRRYDKRRKWQNGQYSWNSKCLVYSKEISKNLVKLQVGIKNSLQRNDQSDSMTQKLILDLPGLCLEQRHQKLLLFVSDENNVLLRTA